MLNKKTLVIAFALALGSVTGALAATKKPIRVEQRPATGIVRANYFASAPGVRLAGEEIWFAKAKGNIGGF